MRGWLVALIACCCMAFSPAARAVPLMVDFKGSDAELVLSRNAQILEDAGNSLTLQRLLGGVHGWSDYHGDTFNFGFTRSSWWVRVRLRNDDDHEVRRVLDVGSALQDEVDIYVVRGHDAQGASVESVEHIATGDRRPFDARPVETRVPSVPLRFAPGEQIDVYMKLATHDGLHEAVAFKLWQPRAYARAMQTENLVFGLYYGALMTVLAYNLFLFVSTRQRSFGLYALYVSAFLFWSFTFRGYAFQYLWPDAPVFNNQVLPIAAAACYCTFTFFMTSYLDTRRNAPPWLHRMVLASAVGNALCVTPALFNMYALSFAASIPFGVMLMTTSTFVGGKLLREGSRPARYFIISFSLLTIGVLLYYLRILGVVPSNLLTENGLQIGSATEVLLLAFGLADQMNQLKAGKLRAEREARAAQAALAVELESLVKRRTKALESANQRLLESAVADDLTGAYNQRHFDAVLKAQVASHARSGSPMALCLFNLDHFQRYNEWRGDAAGDEALQRVAQAVRQRLRRAGDQLFRLDGDQFAILLNPAHSAGETPGFVDGIRADVEALKLEGSAVTASFGLLILSSTAPAHSVDEVLDATTRLLGQAKQQRNVVRSQVWAGAADRTRLRVVSGSGRE